MKILEQFQKRIGISFEEISFLEQAFTHRSYLNENPNLGRGHNERLEFLGDAVLELVVTNYLYHEYPDHPEGDLTAYRSSLVNTNSISEAASELGMNECLMLSRGESRDTGRARQYILANTFEAVVGAIYLDRGYDIAGEFISKALFGKLEDIIKQKTWKDSKSWVQEEAQERLSVTPEYRLVSAEGPDHDKVFIMGIFFNNEKVAEGEGKSKQDAEQEAARNALEKKKWV
ncbi:MAG: ribonuclease-3 [Flavobacteriaceae bacterium]|jgi:ribonuclease-3